MMKPLNRLLREFARNHPGDAAQILERRTAAQVATILSNMDPESAARVLGYIYPLLAAESLVTLEPEFAGRIVAKMSANAAGEIMRRLEPADRQPILDNCGPDVSKSIRSLVKYPEGTVATLMEARAPAVPEHFSVGETLKVLDHGAQSGIANVYLVDRENRLRGVAPIGRLLGVDPAAGVSGLSLASVPTIPAATSIYAAITMSAWEDYDELPVVEANRRFAGVLRHRSLRTAQSAAFPTAESGSGIGALLATAEYMWLGLFGVLDGLSRKIGEDVESSGGSQ